MTGAITQPTNERSSTNDERLEQLRGLYRIRLAEEKVMALRASEDIVGSVHLCNGQEAIAVGVCEVRRTSDPLFVTYRGHGWALACGVDMASFFAELLGRATGVNGGRGGSAYFSDRSVGFYGENSIVGAGAPIACGMALGSQLRNESDVSICVFGDGAINQGSVSEAFNFAAARNLPIVFVLENNRYSELTPIAAMVRNDQLHERVHGFGIPSVRIDGNDVDTVAAATADALDRARRGDGPMLVEAMTERIVGHYIGDAQTYRAPGEIEDAMTREPIVRLRAVLTAAGVADTDLDAVHRSAADEVDAAAARALAAPLAPADRVREHLRG